MTHKMFHVESWEVGNPYTLGSKDQVTTSVYTSVFRQNAIMTLAIRT